jgi:ABC-type nitrate/sulfonate/bicarbonate transport system substrate-binding protein
MLIRTLFPALLVTASVMLFYSAYNGDFLNYRAPLTPVSIAVSRTPLSAPIYIADSMGLFKRHGLDVTLHEVIGGYRSFAQVMDGHADFGTSSDSVLAFAALEKQPYVALATFVQSSDDIKILSHKDSNVVTTTDLAGKKIGVVRGSASEYFLSVLTALNGSSPDNMELISLHAEEMPEALQSGRVQVTSCWEPFCYRTMKLMDLRASVLPTKGLNQLTFNLLSKKDYADAHQETVYQVLASLKQAIQHISQRPHEIQALLKSRLDLEDDFIQWIWPDYLFRLSISNSLLLNLNNQARWAMENDLTGERELPDFEQYFDPRALTRLMPESVLF